MKSESIESVEFWKFSETATDKHIMKIDDPKEFLKTSYASPHSFGVINLKESGIYRLMGWAYNFRPYLKKYLIKQYGQWSEYYAPNKTTLRSTIYGRIDKIVEIT